MSGYTDYVEQLTILAQAASESEDYSLANNPDFSNSIPFFISYAEQRIYKECIFLATRTQETTTFTAGVRSISTGSLENKIIVVEGVAAITPVNTAPQDGTRWQFQPVSLDMIDMVWPTESSTSSPLDTQTAFRYWAMYDDQTIVVAPTMDAAYTAEITGIFQPTALSAANPDTYLTLNYMPFMLAASMIYYSGWARDYGAQADDPKMAQSWTTQYETLRESVVMEEQRRRGQGTGWSAMGPTPLAAPPRT